VTETNGSRSGGAQKEKALSLPLIVRMHPQVRRDLARLDFAKTRRGVDRRVSRIVCTPQPHWIHGKATTESDASQISRIGVFFIFQTLKKE
jgi:hypothetical protein